MILFLIGGCLIKDTPSGPTNSEVILSFILTILIVYMIANSLLFFTKKEEEVE